MSEPISHGAKRRAFLEIRFGPSLQAAAAMDFTLPEGRSPMDVLAESDPSPGLEYLTWLCRTYARRTFLAEDGPRVRHTLSLYHRWKRRLPIEQRDILRHPDEQSVWTAISQFAPSETEDITTPSGRELRRRERLRALCESDVTDPAGLDGWLVAVPETHFAARWWGRGTRWCTSMKSAHHFEFYTARGPLRVFIDPDGEKFQVHVATSSCADASDMAISLEGFVDRIPAPAVDLLRMDAAAAWAGFRNGDGILGNELPLLRALVRLPDSILGPDIVAAARQAGLDALTTIVEDGSGWKLSMATRTISKWALGLAGTFDYPSQPSYLILSRPDEPRLDVPLGDGNRIAFQSLGSAIGSAPSRFRDETACAVTSLFHTKGGFYNRDGLPAFIAGLGEHAIPRKAWHSIAAAIAKYGSKRCGYSIPAAFVDDETADILSRGTSLGEIPLGLLTDERMISVLRRNPSLLAEQADTPELVGRVNRSVALAVATAIKGKGMEFVPARFVTRDFCAEVLRHAPAAVSFVPSEFLDEETCIGIVSTNGWLVNDIPAKWRTERVWRTALNNNTSVFCQMPDEYRDEETCRRVIEAGPDQFPHINRPLPYRDYLRGVKVSGSLLARVPLPYRDEEMCRAAVEKQFDARVHVPVVIAKTLAAQGMESMKGAKLSSRYGAGHPIHEFVLPDKRPDCLLPILPDDHERNDVDIPYSPCS